MIIPSCSVSRWTIKLIDPVQVCALLEALSETDELVGNQATVWSDGDMPLSRAYPNESGLILVRPVDLEAPRADAFELYEPYITDDELAALLSRRADWLRFGERSRQAVLEDLVFLLASEPGVVTFEETGNRGVVWVGAPFVGTEVVAVGVFDE